MARFVLTEEGWRWMNRCFDATPISQHWGVMAVLASLEPFEADGFTQVELRKRAAERRMFSGENEKTFDEWWAFYLAHGLIARYHTRAR